MSKTRRRFTDEVKREAVRLCGQPDAVIKQVAVSLGVEPERAAPLGAARTRRSD